MGDDINWLITILYGDTLLRCALHVKRNALPGDCAEYPMEPGNRKAIHALLPLHVQTCGPVVAVEELFEVHVANAAAPRNTEGQLVLHPYHCPLDGEQLIEIGLGMLICRRCETQFVPTLGPSDGEAGLSWTQNTAAVAHQPPQAAGSGSVSHPDLLCAPRRDFLWNSAETDSVTNGKDDRT